MLADKGNSRITRICDKIVYYTIILILLFSLASCFYFIFKVEYSFIGASKHFFAAVWLVVLCLGTYLLRKVSFNFKTRVWLIIGMVIANTVMIATLLSHNTRPSIDFLEIWRMAKEIADGTYSTETAYWYEKVYNWQLGMAWVESLPIRLFGPSFTMLKILNLLIINATIVATYLLARKLTNRKCALVSFLLFCTFYPMTVTVGQPTNQHLVTLFIIVFIYLVNRDKYLLAGILLPIMSFIRPIGIILLLSLICWWIYRYFRDKNIKKITVYVLSFLIPYFAVTYAIDKACINAGYTDYDVSKARIPYYKFHKGMGVDEYEYDFINDMMRLDWDIDRYNEWQKNVVLEGYKTRPFHYMWGNLKKMVAYLGLQDYKVMSVYEFNLEGKNRDLIENLIAFGWAEYMFLIILCLWGIGVYHRKHHVDYLQILFIGMTLVYVFIEAYSNYRYENYPLMFIFAGYGLSGYTNGIERLINRFRSKKSTMEIGSADTGRNRS